MPHKAPLVEKNFKWTLKFQRASRHLKKNLKLLLLLECPDFEFFCDGDRLLPFCQGLVSFQSKTSGNTYNFKFTPRTMKKQELR